MPIDAPTPVTASVVQTVEQTFQHLWIVGLNINASGPPNGRNDPPAASMVLRPCNIPADGPPEFSDQAGEDHWATANLEAAATNLATAGFPELAQAIAAVYAATPSLIRYRAARKVELDAATAAVPPAEQALADAEAALVSAQQAKATADADKTAADQAAATAAAELTQAQDAATAAHVAADAEGATDADREAAVAADQAVADKTAAKQAADVDAATKAAEAEEAASALDASQAARDALQEALTAARDKAQRAEKAWQDPANPRV